MEAELCTKVNLNFCKTWKHLHQQHYNTAGKSCTCELQNCNWQYFSLWETSSGIKLIVHLVSIWLSVQILVFIFNIPLLFGSCMFFQKQQFNKWFIEPRQYNNNTVWPFHFQIYGSPFPPEKKKKIKLSFDNKNIPQVSRKLWDKKS